MHRDWGPPLVTDLHIGGSLMWVVGDTLMLWPMIPLAIEWMHLEERRAVRIDRELDATAGVARFFVGRGLLAHYEGADHALLGVTRTGHRYW